MAADRRSGRARLAEPVRAKAKKASVRDAAPVAPIAEPHDDETLTDRAYRLIEELIVTLALPPETILSEQSLAQRLGIGRTPIREALWRLARERLVTIIPHRGIIVSEINIKLQLRLLELRRVVERLVASRARFV